MTTTNVALWNTVAASNSDIDGNNVTGSGQVSTADNSFRSIMSQVAKFYADLGGVNTVGGTGDVITITTSSVFTALATGLVLAFKAGAANTTDATVAVDGLAAKHIHKFTTAEVALAANDIITGGKYLMIYDAAANSAAGAWILLNPAPSTATTSPSISTVVSASTTLIGAAASAEVNITGTTTITAFDTVAAGTVREGYFSGILTLTHNGTSLILPGGVSITTAANDRFRALSLGSGNWLVLSYRTATGLISYLDVANQVVTGGARITSNAVGTVSSGTTTLDPGTRPMWDYTNNGAHTLAPGANTGSIILDITNGASAGAITTSGWTKVVGAFDTVNAHKFRCFCSIGAGGSLLTIQNLF